MGSSTVTELPLLPLRDVVVYPHMVLPLFVGREKSIEALEDAMASDKQVLLVAQRNASDDNPGADDIYQVGTVSNILQLLKLPDGTIKVLVEGGYRAMVDSVDDEGNFAVAGVREIESEDIPEDEVEAQLQLGCRHRVDASNGLGKAARSCGDGLRDSSSGSVQRYQYVGEAGACELKRTSKTGNASADDKDVHSGLSLCDRHVEVAIIGTILRCHLG